MLNYGYGVWLECQTCDSTLKHRSEMVSILDGKSDQLVAALKEMEVRYVVVVLVSQFLMCSLPR